MTMSPTFQCSLEGLASAVRLRYVVMGKPENEIDQAVTDYMAGYNIARHRSGYPDTIADTIRQIIRDIERITTGPHTIEQAEQLAARVDATMRAEFEVTP